MQSASRLSRLLPLVVFLTLAACDGDGGTRPDLPPPALWNEVAYLAYHLHWDLDRLLDLQHPDRIRLINLVAEMNDRAWEMARHGQ